MSRHVTKFQLLLPSPAQPQHFRPNLANNPWGGIWRAPDTQAVAKPYAFKVFRIAPFARKQAHAHVIRVQKSTPLFCFYGFSLTLSLPELVRSCTSTPTSPFWHWKGINQAPVSKRGNPRWETRNSCMHGHQTFSAPVQPFIQFGWWYQSFPPINS